MVLRSLEIRVTKKNQMLLLDSSRWPLLIWKDLQLCRLTSPRICHMCMRGLEDMIICLFIVHMLWLCGMEFLMLWVLFQIDINSPCFLIFTPHSYHIINIAPFHCKSYGPASAAYIFDNKELWSRKMWLRQFHITTKLDWLRGLLTKGSAGTKHIERLSYGIFWWSMLWEKMCMWCIHSYGSRKIFPFLVGRRTWYKQ